MTSPPNLLSETDLIGLMDKYGIGTDATHAEHIETIQKRKYVRFGFRLIIFNHVLIRYLFFQKIFYLYLCTVEYLVYDRKIG